MGNLEQAAEKKPLIVLTGPTAVGKTALSIQLARRIGGEIISADSMQVYRHMDIGTAKIRLEEMDGVPHHLIDILEPTSGQQYLFQCPQRMADPSGTAGNSGGHCLWWNLPHRIPEPSNLRNQGSPGTCSFLRPHRLFDLLTVHFSTCVVHTLCLCSSGNGRGCFYVKSS